MIHGLDEMLQEEENAAAGGSASDSTDLLCVEYLTESAIYYYIAHEDGTIYAQRKAPISASDRELDDGEKAMVRVCKTLISAQKLSKKLKDKYDAT